MRIVVAGPPKTGNVWLKCMLAIAYGLRPLGPRDIPKPPHLPRVTAWLRAGGFPDDTILHQHFDYSPELVDQFAALHAHLVTIVRDPYDAFVSAYYALQTHIDDGKRSGRRTDVILGKSLDSPEVYEFLRSNGFRRNLILSRDWIQSGRSRVVRYEHLLSDPLGELRRLTAGIRPVPDARLSEAVEECSADTMRKRGGGTAKHVRTAKVGDSHDKLNEEHLAIFRDMYADLIPQLGYEIR